MNFFLNISINLELTLGDNIFFVVKNHYHKKKMGINHCLQEQRIDAIKKAVTDKNYNYFVREYRHFPYKQVPYLYASLNDDNEKKTFKEFKQKYKHAEMKKCMIIFVCFIILIFVMVMLLINGSNLWNPQDWYSKKINIPTAISDPPSPWRKKNNILFDIKYNPMLRFHKWIDPVFGKKHDLITIGLQCYFKDNVKINTKTDIYVNYLHNLNVENVKQLNTGYNYPLHDVSMKLDETIDALYTCYLFTRKELYLEKMDLFENSILEERYPDAAAMISDMHNKKEKRDKILDMGILQEMTKVSKFCNAEYLMNSLATAYDYDKILLILNECKTNGCIEKMSSCSGYASCACHTNIIGRYFDNKEENGE